MNRAARIYRIHALLRGSRRPVPFRTFVEALEVSDATIKRDFQMLRDYLEAPLEYDPIENGYFYREDESRFELPGLWLNHSELYALLAAEQLLESVQPGILRDRIGPLRGRIRQLLGTSGTDAEALGQRIQVERVVARSVPESTFHPVAEATLSRRQLAFSYHGRARDAHSCRTVHPQQLLHYRGNWYVSAWCAFAQGLRMFSLDRIGSPRVLEQHAEDMDAAELDRHQRASFGIFTGRADEWAVLRFSDHAARWVADEQWHPDQLGHRTPDGSWELQVPFSDPRELMQEILRHADEVEVVAPEWLRTAVRERLEAALGRYRGDG